MSHSHFCGLCGTVLVVTTDALGRPRFRCPSCEGALPARETAGTRGSQAATSAHDRDWPAPDPNAHTPRPRTGAPVPAKPQACRECGAPLVQSTGRGRPRVRCPDQAACAARARERR